jgi:hypothetical protein
VKNNRQRLKTVTTILAYIDECVDGVQVIWLTVEVVVEQGVDAGLEEDGVVHRRHPHFRPLVPTRLPATSVRPVHDVVGDQEKSLQLKFKNSWLIESNV